MNMKYSRFKIAKRLLIFWCLFIGIGAVAGAVGMFSAPDGSALGMQQVIQYFQVLPFADTLFQDFIFPGIALLCVNGITNLAAALLLLCRKKAGIIFGGIFGVTLMAWILIQFIILPPNFMSIIYFVFGAIQAANGYAAFIFYKQEHFEFDAGIYKRVGTTPKELVVYFSRMGYTRKIAYQTAEKSGAAVFEIKATEKTEGTGGFWWCGRYGMHGWDMPIEKTRLNLADYDRVTVCSPIWVFGLAAPVRAFCREAHGQIKRADYILVHHMNSSFKGVADQMDALLGIKREKFTSIRCRTGKYKTISEES